MSSTSCALEACLGLSEMGDNMGDMLKLEHEIANLQQERRKHCFKYCTLMQNLQRLADSDCLADSARLADSADSYIRPMPPRAITCPPLAESSWTPNPEDTPELITNLLPQVIFDALKRKRNETDLGMPEEFSCTTEDEAVKNNYMPYLIKKSAIYTDQQRKLASVHQQHQQQSLVVLSHYITFLEQDLATTKSLVETQNILEKYPLGWETQLTKFWIRSKHTNAGENINAVFVAHFLGYARMTQADVVPAIDPEVHEETLQSVGYYEGEPGTMSLARGISYKVNMRL